MKKLIKFSLTLLSILVSEVGFAQTLTNDPQIICEGETRPYRVDWQAPDGPDGTVGSTYVWSVLTGGFAGVITTNQSPGGFNNHIIINWGATPPGVYTVQVIETNNGCPSAPITLNVQILPSVTPVTSFTYPTPVCANNANITPTPGAGFTAGGTYSSTAGLVINAATGEIDVATSTPGTYTVTYSVAASGCQLAGSSTFSVTIDNNITPVTSFTYPTPVCANNANITPTPGAGFTAGGTYSSTAGLVINAATGEIDVATSTPGTYTVTYSVAASGCQLAGSSTFSVTIDNNITPVTSFTYPTPVCANNANITPTPGAGFTAGGTYSSTAGLVINASTGEIDVATSTPGTYTVTYSVAASGCQLAGSSTFSVTIDNNITPVTSFTYPTPVCANNANITPTPGAGFTAGGTYSSTAGLVINASTGEIDVATSTPGTYTVTYSVAASGCQLAGSSTFSVTIDNNITPVTSFTYPTPVCANNANITPTPGAGFTAGGTYSSTAGLVINAATGEIDVATSTPGTYTVTYSVAASGCQLAGSSTFSVTIDNNITPVTSFTYPTPVCANNANITPTPGAGFTAGGTYSSTAGLVINASTGEIDVATSTPGTYTVTYSVAASGCQLAGSSTFSVTIDNNITPVTSFTYPTPVCANNANITPTPGAGFTAGGTYSSTAGLVINASTGEIDVATSTPGTYTVTYSVAASGCQLAGSSTFSVTIDNNITPVTSFTYPTPVCANNANITPTPGAGFTAGGTYSSTAGLVINASTGEIDVATSTPGTYTVTYSVAASGCQLAGSSTFSVTIDNNITPVTSFTYPTPVCANNANITPTPGAGFTAGGTYSSTAGLVINASTGEIDVATSTPGTYTVTYSVAASGCQLAGSSTFSVTIDNNITPVTSFTYPTPVCANNANITPTPGAGFTAGGTYSSTAGLVINASTGEIDVATSTPGTYTVTYSVAASGCQLAGSSTFSVTIDNNITPVTSFTYPTPVCANNANITPTPGAGFTAGGTYSSTAGLVINASTGEIDVATSTPGTYTVTYSVAASGCQLAGSSTFSVTIDNNITPVTSFTYPTPVCANNANITPTPGAGFTAGGTYSSTAGLVINAATGEIDVATSTPGTYTVTYSVAASGCQLAGSSTFSVTIDNNITPVTSFTYPTPVCANNANITPTPGAGFTAGGTYSSTAGLVINAATGEIDVATSTPGTYTVTYSVAASGCQLAGSSTFSVTIDNNITPVTSFTYPTPVCANNANITPTPGAGFTAGGTYSSTAGLVINASTGEIDVATSTPGTYTVTYSVAASGCQLAGSSTFSVTIDNNITPVTSFTYPTPVCANNANITPTPGAGFTAGGTYSSTAGLVINAATGEIDVATSTPGTYTVTYSVAASGCQLAGSSTFSVTIDPTPVTSPIFHD